MTMGGRHRADERASVVTGVGRDAHTTPQSGCSRAYDGGPAFGWATSAAAWGWVRGDPGCTPAWEAGRRAAAGVGVGDSQNRPKPSCGVLGVRDPAAQPHAPGRVPWQQLPQPLFVTAQPPEEPAHQRWLRRPDM